MWRNGLSKKNRKRKNSRHRNVYIIARPLQIAGRASFLSDRKFPFCHWGLLVTKTKPVEMSWRIRNIENTVRDRSSTKPWGTLFELCRDPYNKNTYNVGYGFLVEEWYLEWKHISMAFIGNTKVSDEMLVDEGEIHINTIMLTNHQPLESYKTVHTTILTATIARILLSICSMPLVQDPLPQGRLKHL
jgi:hypothetical protein